MLSAQSPCFARWGRRSVLGTDGRTAGAQKGCLHAFKGSAAENDPRSPPDSCMLAMTKRLPLAPLLRQRDSSVRCLLSLLLEFSLMMLL